MKRLVLFACLLVGSVACAQVRAVSSAIMPTATPAATPTVDPAKVTALLQEQVGMTEQQAVQVDQVCQTLTTSQLQHQDNLDKCARARALLLALQVQRQQAVLDSVPSQPVQNAAASTTPAPRTTGAPRAKIGVLCLADSRITTWYIATRTDDIAALQSLMNMGDLASLRSWVASGHALAVDQGTRMQMVNPDTFGYTPLTQVQVLEAASQGKYGWIETKYICQEARS